MPLLHKRTPEGLQKHPLRDKAALEIGHISINWSQLEVSLGEFVAHLMGLTDKAPVLHILGGNTDMRSKIQMAKGLAHVCHTDKEWLSTTLRLLDFIDNDLRARRNAVIHGDWLGPFKGRLIRRSRKTRLIRPQSFQLSLETEQTVPVKISELKQLRKDIVDAFLALFPIFCFMIDETKEGGLASSPDISWRQFLRLAGFGDPLRYVSLAQRRQQKALQASK